MYQTFVTFDFLKIFSLFFQIKKNYDNGLCSDHLALKEIYDNWNSLTEEAEISEYIEKNLLDGQSLERIRRKI